MKCVLLAFLIVTAGFSTARAQTPRKVIGGGLVNDRATMLVEPAYPPAARAVRATGAVSVQVLIDENGDVVMATAVSGHPLLRAAAVQAARKTKFTPTVADGEPVRVSGMLVFIFLDAGIVQSIGAALGDAETEIESVDKLSNAADDLKNAFPELSQTIRTIVENYERNQESARFQSGAIGDVIARLQTLIAVNPKNLWHFEFGLTIGRIKANAFDDNALRANLPKLRELMIRLSETDRRNLPDEELKALEELSALADKAFFTRKDKSLISKLLQNF
ncbi:MAG: energy transducer TonB [Acidobacteria bacterium]|nr:energy transducer TonB [Acidobacteriota bacterium]